MKVILFMTNMKELHIVWLSTSLIIKTCNFLFTEMSESLITLFKNPVVAEHSGGHYVACSGSIKDAYLDFLHDVYEDLMKNEESEVTEDS